MDCPWVKTIVWGAGRTSEAARQALYNVNSPEQKGGSGPDRYGVWSDPSETGLGFLYERSIEDEMYSWGCQGVWD